jgi:hypothetical protein
LINPSGKEQDFQWQQFQNGEEMTPYELVSEKQGGNSHKWMKRVREPGIERQQQRTHEMCKRNISQKGPSTILHRDRMGLVRAPSGSTGSSSYQQVFSVDDSGNFILQMRYRTVRPIQTEKFMELQFGHSSGHFDRPLENTLVRDPQVINRSLFTFG